MKSYRTTARHFSVFSAEVRRLVKLWGLTDWDVRLRHEALPDALATCDPRAVSRICVIRLSSTWGPNDPPSDDAVKGSARHEVAHLFTGELVTMARSRYVTDDELTAAIEVTARRLERILP